MISIRNLLAGSLLAAGALVTAATSISLATAADDTATTTTPPPPGPHGWHHHGAGHLLSKLNLSRKVDCGTHSVDPSGEHSGPSGPTE